ncbi:hypothetical protein BJX62DRAFT_204373 [Aspergillus germanicus]
MLFPDSFANLFPNNPGSLTGTSDAAPKNRFDTYEYLHYPLERALVENIAKAAIDEETTTVGRVTEVMGSFHGRLPRS